MGLPRTSFTLTMENNFIQNLIVSLRHQMLALDQSLAMLEEQMKQQTAPVVEVPKEDVCPKCGNQALLISRHMDVPRQYQCLSAQCDWRSDQ